MYRPSQVFPDVGKLLPTYIHIAFFQLRSCIFLPHKEYHKRLTVKTSARLCKTITVLLKPVLLSIPHSVSIQALLFR